jgi:hypothetical protein
VWQAKNILLARLSKSNFRRWPNILAHKSSRMAKGDGAKDAESG